MADFLASMEHASRKRVERAKQYVPFEQMCVSALNTPVPPPLTLSRKRFDIIAEIKRRAPSAGLLHTSSDTTISVIAQRDAYMHGGATAISVLTEPSQFSGNLQDLETVTAGASTPIMRKDFLVDPYQIFEARLHGAAGVLLIARMIDPNDIERFVAAAETTQQFILLEMFDQDELGTVESFLRAASDRPVRLLIGVNARNLVTLGIDTDRFSALKPSLPNDVPVVAESGLLTEDDIAGVASLGYRAALVGTALMRSADPASTVSQFLAAGRKAAQCTSA